MIFLKQLALLARNMPRVAMAALFSPPTLPDAIRDAALDMGPVYVKLLQVMSTRADVLPENFRSVFATLCDRAPVVSDDVMRPLIERAFYPRKLDDVFSEFPQAPIAAGAIAQVYKAKLSDGSLVAVKILRPHVRLAIEGNFKVLRAAASALAFCSKSFHHANIVGIVHELQELLLAQTNLEQEAANLEEIHRLFAGSSQVIAPRTYPEHSTQDALVMEFIEGTHPKDFRQLAVSPLVLAGRVDFLVDIMIFFKGFCHADLHPGTSSGTSRASWS